MRKIFLLAIYISSIAFHSFAQTQKKSKGGLLIQPANIEFKLDKGRKATATVYVTNNLSKSFQLDVEIKDWTRSETGKTKLLDVNTGKHSCASWLSLDKTYMEAGPGQKVPVVLTINVPDSVSAVDEVKWSSIVIKTVKEMSGPKKLGQIQPIYEQSVGAHIKVINTPPGVTNKELKMLSFDPLKDTGTYRIVCQNLGALILSCNATIELTSLDGSKITIGPKDFTIFPEEKRFIDIVLPKTTPKGSYTAVAIVDAGDDDVPLEVAQTSITVF